MYFTCQIAKNTAKSIQPSFTSNFLQTYQLSCLLNRFYIDNILIFISNNMSSNWVLRKTKWVLKKEVRHMTEIAILGNKHNCSYSKRIFCLVTCYDDPVNCGWQTYYLSLAMFFLQNAGMSFLHNPWSNLMTFKVRRYILLKT